MGSVEQLTQRERRPWLRSRFYTEDGNADPKYGEMVAEALGIDISTVDTSSNGEGSYEDWLAERARDKELDYPTEPAEPKSAEGLPPEGRDTNVDDPTTLTSWEDDPYLL